MAEEPVKVKMTLHAAKPTAGGSSSSPSLAAAAVESVEARFRKESEERAASKESSGNNRSQFITGCLTRIVLVLAVVGGIWYFFGEKFLLPEYTFPRVWQQVQQLWK